MSREPSLCPVPARWAPQWVEFRRGWFVVVRGRWAVEVMPSEEAREGWIWRVNDGPTPWGNVAVVRVGYAKTPRAASIAAFDALARWRDEVES